MPFPIEQKLVVAVASSALFDLRASDRVFRTRRDAYREYQRAHEDEPLKPGVAFPFIRRLLEVSGKAPTESPVEVVLLSRNDPDTGLRVFNSIEAHGLRISRAAFLAGRSPWAYIAAFNACLFLSENAADVQEAVDHKAPAGRVLPSSLNDDASDRELRIAFDFDGVVADNESERVYQKRGIDRFFRNEVAKAQQALKRGPLGRLFTELSRLQALQKDAGGASDGVRIRTAIVTSRNAPAHKRLVTTLRAWDIEADETFFLGGMDKRRILSVLRPHIFFDDQLVHAGPAAGMVPSVHVPFGISNKGGPSHRAGRAKRAARRKG